ncbi:GerMN domain-containing protein [Streptomyces sp. NRRL S-1824]|uniref:GerMN domain-containing protein n=1 Tax=Streptomyces sp. NRRL S-1824 TaxID=1463889 RepID=UPI0004CB9B4C|nr:GerMN domain-containing protein [Streptomyces sp. NRRL S-1824]
MKVRQAGVVAALGLALMGCGVQPTGVTGAGEPASGLTRGMRLYFASDSGLRGVPLLDREVKDLNAVVKLLAEGPPPAEQRDGLTSLVQLGGYSVTGTGTRVTVRLDGPYALTGRDQGTGQVVCTLARAQSVLDPKVRADDVEVTLRPSDGASLGPYRCAEFLNG